ncbi:MAG: DUF3794 domain-containing protein [Sporomusaceae bacterium]|nr:DUF3794 domain-containing protein [Sporomusaceae bacterium]
MDEKDLRAYGDPCTLGVQTGPQTIVVRQVIGEKEKQKVLDIHVTVPAAKPAIEQIIDVLVKDVEVNSIDVITDKVIVRGEFEIKTIYVADLPNLPVHAIEIKHYKWTQDIDLPGARRGMDADASVIIEFVDYDVDDDYYNRAYNFKKYDDDCDETDDDDTDNCDHDCDDHDCDHHHHHHHHHDCDDDCDGHHHHHHCHLREFDVSVVLKIVAKVMADREVQLNYGVVPTNPKG